MKKTRKKLRIFTFMIITAIVLSLLGNTFLFQKDSSCQTINAKTAVSIKPWNKSSVYLSGDKVTYNNKTFQAKWWTQGEVPTSENEWGVWKVIKSTKKQNTSTTNSKTDSNKESKTNTQIKTNKNIVKGFKIVGYFPEWQPNAEKEIQYDKLTHINYSFAIPTANSTLRPLENPELAKKIIKNGHKNKVKVLLAVGGWSYQGTPLESTFVSATRTNAKCKKLANSILSMVDKYGFDGVDMDWEHPRIDNKSGKQYEQLIKYLRIGLDQRKKLLTCAVLAGVTPDGTILYDAAAHSNTVLNNVNWLNVMAYDGGDGKNHSSYAFAVNSANYWINKRKVPKSKVVLGVPFYARPSWASYKQLLESNKNAHTKDVISYNGVDAYYNGIKTIKNKTNWALKNAGGIMIWELSQDTTNKEKSLLNAIYKTAIKK